MSNINEALKKAQKEKDARSLAYSSIAAVRGKVRGAFGKRLLFGALAGITFVLLAFISYPWLDFAPTQADKESQTKPQETAPAPPPGQEVVNNARALYDRARHFHKAGSLERAGTLYRETLKSDPGHVDALNNLGVLHLHKKNYRAAQANFEKAIRLRPGSVDPYYNLACLCAMKGDLRQGLVYLKKAVSLEGLVRDWARRDRDLENLRRMPEFQKIVGEVQ